MDVRKALKMNLRQFTSAIIHQPSDLCSVIKNATLLTLAQHLVERALIDVQSIAAQHGSHQCRALLLANRWQLCMVADEHHPTVTAIIHKANQVVQQTAALAIETNHRGLVDDEQRVLGIVIAQLEATLQRLLTIDAAVDGIGRTACIQREHLGGTPCWCQQYQLLLQRLQSTDNGCC